MNKTRLTLLSALTTVLLGLGPVVAEAAGSSPAVSPLSSGLYHRMGGGEVILPAGSTYTSYVVTARLKATLGYSCGKFNFSTNVADMVNQIQTQLRAMPGALRQAFSAAVAGLPMYFLKKQNSTLADIITKTLDESTELFRLSYKSCHEIEAELNKNKDAEPYGDFINGSIADKWHFGATTGALAADQDQNIKDNPPTSFKWLGGADYGTAAKPVQVNHDIIIAGYNILIGRARTTGNPPVGGDVSDTSAPTVAAQLSQPIVQVWSDPLKAATWAQQVLGDQQIVLGDGNQPKTIAGMGLKPKIAELVPQISAAFKKAMDQDDYSDINKYQSVHMSRLLIDSLRHMPMGDRVVMTDRLVNELAVNEAVARMDLIRQAIMTGLNAPDVSASTGASGARKYISKTTFPTMDRLQKESMDDLELREKTINTTEVAILNHADALRRSAATTGPGQMITTDNGINGAVKQ